MFNCKYINIPQHTDERGILHVLQNDANMPFSINRVFWITDVEGKERGKHAHNTCAELLVAAEGSFLVDVRDSDDTEKFQTFSVNAKDNRGLLIPAKTWCRLHDFTPGTVCLCLASENYNADGYIQ